MARLCDENVQQMIRDALNNWFRRSSAVPTEHTANLLGRPDTGLGKIREKIPDVPRYEQRLRVLDVGEYHDVCPVEIVAYRTDLRLSAHVIRCLRPHVLV